MENAIQSQVTVPDATSGTPGDGDTSPGSVDLPTIAQTSTPGQQSATIDISEAVVSPGEPVPRKRGRPSKADVAARLNSVTRPPPKPVPIQPSALAPAKIVDYESLARIAANLWFVGGEVVLGADWIPSAEEVPLVKTAFKDYFIEVGVTSISPAWQLGIVLGSYSLARAQRPSIKNRIQTALAWLKTKIKR